MSEQKKNWHNLSVDATKKALEADEKGLSADQAAKRLEQFGPNQLAMQTGDSWFKRLILQFHNVLIYVLIVAAVGTALLGEWIDTGVILAVVVVNAMIGFVQEGRAEKAMESIRAMLSPRCSVVRDGRRETIAAEKLVPGDVVRLKAGDRVPADLRIFQAHSLEIDEAVLTGESVPVGKQTDPVEADSDLGDRTSLALSGTLVTAGAGAGLVVETGQRTEIGKVSELLSRVESIDTPLLRQVGDFGRKLSVIILLLAGLTFAVGYWIRDYEAVEMFMAAVSLAVAAIPEGLPAIMTIILAIGVQRMAGRNAIIRRLPAVETLGAVTTICSDKTGTLTRNEMMVQHVITAGHHYQITGSGYEPRGELQENGEAIAGQADHRDEALAGLLEVSMLCNDSGIHEADGQWQLEGEPTEGALLALAMKGGLERSEVEQRLPRIDTLPFDSGRKYMATLHKTEDSGRRILLKGAPEALLEHCRYQRTEDGREALDQTYWDGVMQEVTERGERLLALVCAEASADQDSVSSDRLGSDWTLLGLVGIIDPPREEAKQAVAECARAGIKVKMITGDHAGTARTIGAQLGIGDGTKALTGRELEAMGDEELIESARDVAVFARTTPEHKLRLVQALQAGGQVVAMTGDGVNDAPALKRADVGIAMGRKGTEAAKEASEMVLADDNFASIASAVKEGRTVYDNLKKAILFILPTNFGEALTILAAIALGLALPLLPVQVLWVNMVTAVTLALALAFESAEPELMQRPPRNPATPLLTGLLIWRIGFVSILLVAGTFGHYFLVSMSDEASQEFARTVAINTLVMGQVFYLFNSRYILASSLNIAGILGSRPVLIAIGTLIILQGLFTYSPYLQALFSTTGIGWIEWMRILGFGIALFLLVELEKAFMRRMLGRTGANI